MSTAPMYAYGGRTCYLLLPVFLSDSAFLKGQPLVRLSAPVLFDIFPFSVPNMRLVKYQQLVAFMDLLMTYHQQPIAASVPEPI